MRHIREKGTELVSLISALVSILAVAVICISLFAGGVPTTGKIRIFKFLADETWKPDNNIYDTLPMILDSIYVTAGAILVGIPIGILTTVFMARSCPKRLYRVMKPAIDLLAGIPSIVCRLFRLVVIVPVMSDLFGGNGKSITTASVLLGIMVLPAVVDVLESTINAVPDSYYEGALALGASHERGVFFAVLPTTKSEISADVILGVGRVIGEAMAVIMMVGNQLRMPRGISQGAWTLTANIVMKMGCTTGLYWEALIATAVMLSVFILLINLSFSVLNRRAE